MDKIKEFVSNAFNGENGPAYAGIIGIVLIVLGRYGYKIKNSYDGNEISLEPCQPDDYLSSEPQKIVVDSPEVDTIN